MVRQSLTSGWFSSVVVLGLVALGASVSGCNSEPAGTAPPSIEGLEVETQPLEPGASTALRVEASHPKGKSLSYAWSVSDSVWTLEADGAEGTLTAPDGYGKSVEVTVNVTAGPSAPATETVTVETVPNEAPQITGISASPNPVRQGTKTTLTGRAVDGNDDELSYQWSVDGEAWSLMSTTGAEVSLQAPDDGEATTTVTLTVTDGYDGEATESLTVSARQNGPPVVGAMSANPPQVEPGGTTSVKVSASDPDGDELSYTWSAPENWSVEGMGGQVEVTAPDSFGETAEIEVEVDDGTDTTTGTVTVSTRENNGPLITTLSAAPQTVAKQDKSTLTVSATDPDGDDLSYAWSIDNIDWTLSSSGTSAELVAPDKPSSQVKVEVVVEDVDGKQATASVVVSTQANRPPVLASLDANPPRVAPGQTVTITASASDEDGDNLSYKWSGPQGWGMTNNGNEVEVTPPDDYGVSGKVTVTVSDGFTGQASGTVTVGTVDNAAPSISSVTANPPQVAPKGTVDLSATAADPNGDSLSYKWTAPQGWSVTGSGADVKLEAPDTYGVSATVTVEVSDGNGGKTTAKVQVSTDGNQPPTVSSLTANPPVIQPGGTSTVEALASDPNGDSLSYNWTVPSPWTKKSTNKPHVIEVTGPNKKSASAKVQVEVTDGNGGKETAAVVVRTRLNQPPVINQLTASPTSGVKPGDTVKASAQVSDPEGDPLSYTWKLPKGWKGSSKTASITATAGRNYGKTVDLILEVDDGIDTSTRKVAVQLVANKPPVIKDFAANPNPTQLGKKTTVKVGASDPYGDTLSYKWNLANSDWSKSGSGSSITLTAPNKRSDTKLTVTVEDGHGGTVSKTITVKARRALYPFTVHKFTPCGKSGRTGPSRSQCVGAYTTGWHTDTRYYDVKGGIQHWTVPQTGTYKITVAGARGGYPHDGSNKFGRGAKLTSKFKLQRGQTLKILVGQKGASYPGGGHDWWNSSGGGGTFVYYNASDTTPLMAAGGGGGGSYSVGRHPRMDASLSTSGQDGVNDNGGRGARGGANGDGGYVPNYWRVAGAGAGWKSNGHGQPNDDCGYTVENGRAPRNGGFGGRGGNRQNGGSNYPGGFGGGGGGTGGCGSAGAGAGGGYSGGGSGDGCCSARGGGGGSFSRNAITSSSVSITGDGYVTIEKL